VLGVVVFRASVHVSPGIIALESFGLLALLIGVIMVARAPALARLRSLHPPRHGTLRQPPPHREAAAPPDSSRRPSRLQRAESLGMERVSRF
jgi:hypothetical protein